MALRGPQLTLAMPARLRIEIFPSNLARTIAFYTSTLRFTRIRQSGDYAYLHRDGIFIGAAEKHDLITSIASSLSDDCNGLFSPEAALGKLRMYRKWPVGVEIVIEVDDLEAEREHVLASGWVLDDDIKMQEWGLRDFRIVDPDGYYIRITTHGEGHAIGF